VPLLGSDAGCCAVAWGHKPLRAKRGRGGNFSMFSLYVYILGMFSRLRLRITQRDHRSRPVWDSLEMDSQTGHKVSPSYKVRLPPYC
jgi:hypothetical protein